MVGGVMEDYVRKKTLQGGRHIESLLQVLLVRQGLSDEANIAAYTGDGVNLTRCSDNSGPNNRCHH